MNDWSFYNCAAELIPFKLKGYNGIVSVYYGVNNDPIRVGFDSLAGIHFDLQLSRGYPVIHARVENYEGSGYRMFCGWIQIVTSIYLDSHDHEKARSETFVSADIAPSIEESEIPFASYGYLPQLFDAPCRNLGNYAELRWTAHSFLTTVPLRSRDEEITCLAGFRWGHLETDVPDEKPALLPLEVTDGKAWNQHLAFLRQQYSHWRFKSASA